jgi:hypothetical protein
LRHLSDEHKPLESLHLIILNFNSNQLLLFTKASDSARAQNREQLTEF